MVRTFCNLPFEKSVSITLTLEFCENAPFVKTINIKNTFNFIIQSLLNKLKYNIGLLKQIINQPRCA